MKWTLKHFLIIAAPIFAAAAIGLTLKKRTVSESHPQNTHAVATSASSAIPKGMRALAIRTECGSEPILKVGDHIDITLTLSELITNQESSEAIQVIRGADDPTAHQTIITTRLREETTRTIQTNLLVLGVYEGEPHAPWGCRRKVAVAVSPENAEFLMAADRSGGSLNIIPHTP